MAGGGSERGKPRSGMTIKVVLTISMTDEQIKDLAHEYGYEPTKAETRKFVNTYVRGYADMDGSPGADFWTLE